MIEVNNTVCPRRRREVIDARRRGTTTTGEGTSSGSVSARGQAILDAVQAAMPGPPQGGWAAGTVASLMPDPQGKGGFHDLLFGAWADMDVAGLENRMARNHERNPTPDALIAVSGLACTTIRSPGPRSNRGTGRCPARRAVRGLVVRVAGAGGSSSWPGRPVRFARTVPPGRVGATWASSGRSCRTRQNRSPDCGNSGVRCMAEPGNS